MPELPGGRVASASMGGHVELWRRVSHRVLRGERRGSPEMILGRSAAEESRLHTSEFFGSQRVDGLDVEFLQLFTAEPRDQGRRIGPKTARGFAAGLSLELGGLLGQVRLSTGKSSIGCARTYAHSGPAMVAVRKGAHAGFTNHRERPAIAPENAPARLHCDGDCAVGNDT